MGKATHQSRADPQRRKRERQSPPTRLVDCQDQQAKERIVCSQADIEVIGSMEMEPVKQNSSSQRYESQASQTLLKPNQDDSDKSCEKRQKHIHKGILSQDEVSDHQTQSQYST